MLDSFIQKIKSFPSTTESILIVVSLVLAAALIILVIVLLIKRSHYSRSERSLRRSLKKKGISVIEDEKHESHEKKKGKLRKDEEEINNIVLRLHDLVDAEKQVKSEERKLSKKIEELYHKTQPILEKSDIGKEKKAKEAEKDKDSEESSTRPQSTDKSIDEDSKKVLLMTDELLEKLPDDVVDKFVNSPEFETYKKVLEKVKKNK